MVSPIFFCFPFKEHICYNKLLEITRWSVEATKKERFCPLKNSVHWNHGLNYVWFRIFSVLHHYVFLLNKENAKKKLITNILHAAPISQFQGKVLTSYLSELFHQSWKCSIILSFSWELSTARRIKYFSVNSTILKKERNPKGLQSISLGNASGLKEIFHLNCFLILRVGIKCV